MNRNHVFPSLRWLCLPLPLLAVTASWAQTADRAAAAADDEVLVLPEFSVKGTQDPDAWVGSESVSASRTASRVIDLPFSVQVLTNEFIDSFQLKDLDEFGTFISGFTPGEVESGGGGGSRLRGFVPSTYRNGFPRTGVGEVVNLDRVEIIKGPMSAIYGRVEPGGIVNYITKKAKTKPGYRISASYGDYGYRRAEASATGPVLKDKLFYRVDLSYNNYQGEMDYFYQKTTAASTSWTYKIGPETALTLDLEWLKRTSNNGTSALERIGSLQSGSIVYNRTKGVIDGPSMEFINFNIWGPYAETLREIATANLQFEHRFNEVWSLRSNAQAWRRNFDDERWTTPQYIPETGRFNLREPYLRTLPQESLAFQADLLAHFRTGGIEHKFLMTVDASRTTGHDRDYRYEVAARNALSLDTRYVDPLNPVWVETDRSLFTRPVTDDDSKTSLLGSFVSERMAVFDGRLILLVGGRYDSVKSDYTSNSYGTNPPHTATESQSSLSKGQTSYTAGLTWRVLQDRLVTFLNTSSSFSGDPIFDRGTDSILGYSDGKGYETGFKGLIGEGGALSYTLTGYQIERTNPATNPAFSDPDGTIPEYLGLRRERVRGVDLELYWKATPKLTVLSTIGWMDPKIADAPDNPSLVGDTLVRTPRHTFSGAVRYSFPIRGLSGGLSYTYTGKVVVDLGDRPTVRARESHDGYGLLGAYLLHSWKTRDARHTLRLNGYNLANDDYITVSGRQAKGEELRGSYTLSW